MEENKDFQQLELTPANANEIIASAKYDNSRYIEIADARVQKSMNEIDEILAAGGEKADNLCNWAASEVDKTFNFAKTIHRDMAFRHMIRNVNTVVIYLCSKVDFDHPSPARTLLTHFTVAAVRCYSGKGRNRKFPENLTDEEVELYSKASSYVKYCCIMAMLFHEGYLSDFEPVKDVLSDAAVKEFTTKFTVSDKGHDKGTELLIQDCKTNLS